MIWGTEPRSDRKRGFRRIEVAVSIAALRRRRLVPWFGFCGDSVWPGEFQGESDALISSQTRASWGGITPCLLGPALWPGFSPLGCEYS